MLCYTECPILINHSFYFYKIRSNVCVCVKNIFRQKLYDLKGNK